MQISPQNTLDSIVGTNIQSIEGAHTGSSLLCFNMLDGDQVVFCNDEDTRNDVQITIEDICGDIKDLVGNPVLQAEETSCKNDNISGTWTFYKFATNKGSVTIRWLGVSNGYYSEAVHISKVQKKQN